MSDINKKVEQVQLNSKQKKFLKGLAHPLSAGVLIGKEDLTDPVVDAIKSELSRHELVKIKIGQNSGLDKSIAVEKIPVLTESHFVQLIGKTIVVYKENLLLPKDKRIRLPR
ncbi:MAG: YhbY family RNA-binding protein [Desulfotalea sp.]